jgi:hypothetical protein
MFPLVVEQDILEYDRSSLEPVVPQYNATPTKTEHPSQNDQYTLLQLK